MPAATQPPGREPASAGVHAAVLAGLAVAIGVVYANVLSAPFVLDARVIILENPALRAFTWEHVVTLFTHDYWHPAAVNGLYRPLTQFTYLLDWSVFGHADAPAWYRALNLGLHWGCAALAYVLLLELGAPVMAAALATALFACHPVATEAVTNVIGRADLLATLAVLGGLICHARARRTTGRTATAWHAAVATITLLGLFCKESAAVIVPVVVLWDALIAPPLDRRAARGLGASLAPPLALWAWARTTVLSREWAAETSSLDNPILDAGFWSGRLTALKVVGLQLVTLVWPVRLSVDYGYDQIPLVGWPPDLATVAAAIGVVAFAVLAIGCRRRAPAIAFLLAFYAVALLPTANLLVPIGALMADRFLYLPSVGLWGALVLGAIRLRPPAQTVVMVGLALGVVYAAGATIARNRDWTSEERLWASAVAATPRSAKVHRGYAAALVARDRSAAALDTAVASVRAAVRIRPDFEAAWIDLGTYRLQRGDARAAAGDAAGARADWGGAVAALAHARRLDRRVNRDFHRRMRAHGRRRDETPDAGTAPLYHQLAIAHLRLDQPLAALAAFRQARRLDPWNVAAWLDVSVAYAMLNRWDDAAVTVLAVLALDERKADAQQRLLELYRRLDPTLVVDDGGGRVHIPLDAPRVRDHRCRAYTALAKWFGRARIPTAAQWRRFATQTCGG